jgi:hypothetical protein
MEDTWELKGAHDTYDLPASGRGQCSCLVIDGTRLGTGPIPYITSGEAVETLVTDRWAEYGLGPESEP